MAGGQEDLAARLGPFLRVAGDAIAKNDPPGLVALITGEPRQADVRSQTYCRLLVLRKTDFDRFMRADPNVRGKINEVAERRLMENKPEAAAAT